AFLFIIILPFSEPSWNPEGATLILGAVVPAFAPIIAIILMFDVMMSKIQQSDDSDPAVKLKFRNIIRLNLATAVVLTVFWINAFSDVLF
ncbi:MAG: hypothetical protein ACI9FB_004248, partial [Candidatus Azotimanducaceae bacterium]